jgi:hypothetical protein
MLRFFLKLTLIIFMKHKLTGIFFLILLMASCSPAGENQSQKVPSDLIQPDAMTAVIVDIQIAEAILQEQRRTGQLTDDHAVNYLTEVFEKHNTTKEKFTESVRFYEKNLELYQKIYEDVLTQLTQRQTELKNPEGQTPKEGS